MASPGDRISEYVLEAPIGSGGFGEVWRAHHERLPFSVAIKLAHAPSDAAWMETGGRIQHALEHPGIVKTLGLSLENDPPYLIMELVSGESLRERLLARKNLQPDEVSRILQEVLDALAFAHSKGVIHGDLKPENVLICSATGRARLTDFGLAPPVGEDGTLRLSHASGPSSRTAVGTLGYMAPEVRRGGTRDYRADIFSVGVMAFEMLTGSLPDGLDPPSVLRPDLGTAWDELLRACLAASPERRLKSARDLLARLPIPVSAAASPPVRRRSRWRAVAALLCILCASGILMGLIAARAARRRTLEGRAVHAMAEMAATFPGRVASHQTIDPVPFLELETGLPSEQADELSRRLIRVLKDRLEREDASHRVGPSLEGVMLATGSGFLYDPRFRNREGLLLQGVVDLRRGAVDVFVFDRRTFSVEAHGSTRPDGRLRQATSCLLDRIGYRSGRLGLLAIVDARLGFANADTEGIRYELATHLIRGIGRASGLSILAPTPRLFDGVRESDLACREGRLEVRSKTGADFLLLGSYDDSEGRVSLHVLDLRDGATIATTSQVHSIRSYRPAGGGWFYSLETGQALDCVEALSRQTHAKTVEALEHLFLGRKDEARRLLERELSCANTKDRAGDLHLVQGLLLAFESDLDGALDELERAERLLPPERDRQFLRWFHASTGLWKAQRLYWRARESEGLFRRGDPATYREALRYLEKVESQTPPEELRGEVSTWKARIQAEMRSF